MNSNDIETGEGFLTVRVTTARGAIPLEGAGVTVRNSSGVLYNFTSDGGGLTPRAALPAPPRILSEAPGNVRPYSLYLIEVRHPGYYNQIFESVAIFDGITAFQTAELVALPVNGVPDRFTVENNRFSGGGNYDL